MARFALAALCVAAVVAVSSAQTFTDWGMDMSVEAYESACWYEKLKQFPKTDSKGYLQTCAGKAKFVKSKMKDEAFAKKYFGPWMKQHGTSALPEGYASACDKYLDDANANPTGDESDALRDANNDSSYPFKGFAYCIVGELRKKHGDKAIDAMKAERTHAKKHWMTTLLDRDNEFRKRHGVSEMKLVGELNTAAQKWADKMASECNMYHSKNDDAGRQWRGKGTGESLSAGGGDDDKQVAAYLASDGWYEEIKDYPYPDGYKGKGSGDPLFGKIGHFTQTVWDETKYVGYGYAYNPDCQPYSHFVAARYSPAGNMRGTFPEHVKPPQD